MGTAASSTNADVERALAWLKRRGTAANRTGMARYAIVAPKVFGTSVGEIRTLGKTLRGRHDLAEPLWATGWYEARMLVAFVADPARITPAQMHRWARDFDNWAICDTLAFHLFDRSPHAWRMVDRWAAARQEFVERAAFALLAALALHDKDAPDANFLDRLPLVERAADDRRNFVKKGVSWALRGIGARNQALHAAALAVAERLAATGPGPSRWVGLDARRDLSRPMIAARVARKSAQAAARAAKQAAASATRTARAAARDAAGTRQALRRR